MTLSPPIFELQKTVQFLENILSIFPYYSLVSAINNLYHRTRFRHNCLSACKLIKHCTENNVSEIISEKCSKLDNNPKKHIP